MRKNIIILTIIFMLVISIFPSTFANNNYIDMNSDRDVFNFCYVEIDGDISNQWKICFLKPFGDYRSTVVYWHIEFKPDTTIRIYDDKNGELLYEYDGERELNIIAFGGIYIPSRLSPSSPLHVSITGSVFRIISKKLSNNQDISSESILNNKVNFNNCYIEISGKIHNDWPAIVKLPNLFTFLWYRSDENNILFGTYCYILYEEDAVIKVYNEKDGNLIWEHEGMSDPLIKIIGFKGEYDYIYEPSHLDTVVFSGDVLFTSIRLGDWGN